MCEFMQLLPALFLFVFSPLMFMGIFYLIFKYG